MESIIQVVAVPNEPAGTESVPERTPATSLPDWCNVYAGLTDEQVAEVEEVVLQRSDLSRRSE